MLGQYGNHVNANNGNGQMYYPEPMRVDQENVRVSTLSKRNACVPNRLFLYMPIILSDVNRT